MSRGLMCGGGGPCSPERACERRRGWKESSETKHPSPHLTPPVAALTSVLKNQLGSVAK